MEDFRVKTSWRTSRKRRRLQRLLGAEGVLAIEDLWSYCAAERESGDLSGLSNEDIADEVAWEGAADELIAAFVSCGLLDGEPGSYRIHDWEDHNPYVATGEPRSEKAKYAAHCRWHERQDKVEPDCKWCAGAPAPGADAPTGDTDSNASDAGAYADASSSNAPSLPPANPPSKDLRSRAREIADAVLEVRNRAAAECGLSAPGCEQERKIRDLVPFKPGALDHAISMTAEAEQPNWNYLLKCLRNPRPRSRGSPTKPRDPRYGYHPPSTEFGDGPQQL